MTNNLREQVALLRIDREARMLNDATWFRAMANTARRIAASRKCIGNEITCMLTVDLAEACDELAAMIDRDDARDRDDFSGEADTGRTSGRTQPGVAAPRER